MTIGNTIKEIRERRGWSDKELAAKLNLCNRAVQNLEAGLSVPTIQTLVKLAVVLGVSTDYLLGLTTRSPIFVDALPQKEYEKVDAMVNTYIHVSLKEKEEK